MNLKKLFLMLTMVVFFTTTAFAQQYVSSTGGDDAIGLGTNVSPWATLAKAVSVATAGETIYVADGTYNLGNQLATPIDITKDVIIVGYSRNGGSDVIFDNTLQLKFNSDAISFGASGNKFIVSDILLEKGVITISSGTVELTDGGLITRKGGSLSNAPTFAGDTKVTYTSTANVTAGPELPVELGEAGVLTVAAPAKTVTVATILSAGVVNVATGTTLDMTSGNLTVIGEGTGADDIVNAGTIKLNSNKLLLSTGTAAAGNALIVNNTGKIISTSATAVGSAVVEISGDNAVTLNGVGEYPSISILTGYDDITTVGANITLYGNLTLSSEAAGALTDGGNTISLKGNFVRSNNTVGNLVSTGTLKFTGSGGQSLNPGANLTLRNVTVDSPGSTVTLVNSITLDGDLTITNGSLNAGDHNLFLTGAGKTFNNSGEFYSTTGVGYLIFTANTTLTGTGIFSNLDVRNAATVTVGVATARFAQNLILRSGILALGANDVSLNATSYAPNPKITRYVGAGSVTTAGGAIGVAVTVTYDLAYVLNAAGPTAAGEEWVGAGIRNLSVTKGTVAGQVTAPAELTTLTGTLTLSDAGNTISIPNNIEFNTANLTHSVEGTITGAGILVIKASGVTINGKTTTTAGGSALVDLDVQTSESQTFTLNQIQSITGDLTVANGIASLNFNPEFAATVSGNFTQLAGTITLAAAKGVTVGGTGTFTLGALNVNGNLTITGAATQTTTKITIASGKKLTLLNNYTHNGAGAIEGSGYVVAAPDAATRTYTIDNALEIPYLELKAAAAGNDMVLGGADALTVSNTLLFTIGTLDLNNETLTVSGNVITVTKAADVSFLATGGGVLSLTGSNPVLTTDASISIAGNFTVNSDGTFTLKDDKEGITGQTNNTLTLATLTQTKGGISIGKHSISIGTAFVRTAGSWTMTDGFLIWNSATAANFDQGAGFVIDNLDVNADLDAQALAANKWTINKNLKFGNHGTTSGDIEFQTADNLELADGITIERRTVIANADFRVATVATSPKFLGKVNVVYSGDVTAVYVPGVEWPANATTSKLNSVTVKAGVNALGVQPAAGKENEIISLLDLGGLLDQTNITATLGNGAWFKTTAAANLAAPIAQVTGGTMNVEFANTAALTTDDNYMDIIATPAHKIGDVKFSGTADVTAHANGLFTFTGTVTFGDGGSDYDIIAQDITVKGDVIQTKTTSGFFLENVGANIIFANTADALLTLKKDIVIADATAGAERLFDVEVKLTAGKKLTLSGGNLDFATNSKSLTLTSGTLETSGTASVILKQDQTGGVPTQGFTRTSGVIAGNVKKNILNTATVANTVVTFPLGDINGNYKPATYYFKTAVPNTFDLTVDYQPEAPGGGNGFPITSGTKEITNFSPFFWYAKVSQNLAPSYKYDVEFGAQGYTDYEKDGIENVRLVRRDSGNVANHWVLQGADANYDNSTIAANFPVVKVIDATGGLSVQGAKFSYSQMNKAPAFTSSISDSIAITEGDTLKFTVTAVDPDFGQTATVSLVSAPDSAVVTIKDGVATFTWATTYTDSGSHMLVLSATDGTLTSYDTTKITVVQFNQAPEFTTVMADTQAVAEGLEFTFAYVVKDEADDTLSYSILKGPAGAAIDSNGVFSWTPAYGTNGTFDSLTVVVFDGDSLADSTSSVLRITKTNRAPVLTRVSTSAVTPEGAKFVFEYAATDPDTADALTFSVVERDGKDTTAVMEGSKLTWTPGYTAAGTYYFVVTVKDNGATVMSDSDTLKVIVLNANGAPVFTDVLENQVITFGDSITFTYAATDPDGDALTYAFDGETNEGTTINGTTGEFKFKPVANQTANYLIKVKVGDGHGGITTTSAEITVKENLVGVEALGIPDKFALEQNYPNPFNPTTVIRFGLPEQSNVVLKIYNILGQEVATLLNTVKSAGWHEVNFNASSLSTGLYIYRIEAKDFVSIKKMMLVK